MPAYPARPEMRDGKLVIPREQYAALGIDGYGYLNSVNDVDMDLFLEELRGLKNYNPKENREVYHMDNGDELAFERTPGQIMQGLVITYLCASHSDHTPHLREEYRDVLMRTDVQNTGAVMAVLREYLQNGGNPDNIIIEPVSE